jgi:ATP-dependent Clp protease ATP-binding subunit ClpA
MESLFSRDALLLLESAFEEARARKSQYLTSEHILFALTFFSSTRDILQYLGVDLAELREELEHYFQHYIEKSDSEVQKSVVVDDILNNAIKQALAADRKAVLPEDLLMALFSKPETYAVQLLNEFGVSRVALAEAITLKQQGRLFISNTQESSHNKETLAQVALNLTEMARKNQLEKIVGREPEIKELITILGRKRKSNPLIVGEPGVGKTALVYGLCQKIVSEEVPENLKNAEIFALDISSLLSGTRYRGDFEERLRLVIDELLSLENPIVFIDEIHSIVGAGATVGDSVDAALILKPYIGSGKLKVIGATTFEDFKRHLERDRAFLRRFSVIELKEPEDSVVLEILKSTAKEFEEYHGVRIPLTSVKKALELSKKYLPDKRLPDKAIEVLDHACSLTKLRNQELAKQDSSKRSEIQIVSAESLAQAISDLTKIPFEDTSTSTKTRLTKLKQNIKNKLFGQDTAVELVTNSILRRMTGVRLGNKKPLGSFLFAGPTGVGKTELAKLLAKFLGARFIRFDMSEFMEKHSISKLVGAPPGYVGHEEGGQLVNLVRQNAFNVILFDEIEKAHEDIYMILLQILDGACLTDSHGRKADFSESIIILTTNLGSQSSSSIGFGDNQEQKSRLQAIESFFKPEFRNRLDAIVLFKPLELPLIDLISQKFLSELADSLKQKGFQLLWDDEVVRYISTKAFDPKMGARPIARFVEQVIGDKIADWILKNSPRFKKLRLALKDGQIVVEQTELCPC